MLEAVNEGGEGARELYESLARLFEGFNLVLIWSGHGRREQ